MSSILSQGAPQVFACPKCGEMINTSMAQCAYCNAPVDPQWAAWAANAQATIASAFNHANNIMNVARALIAFFVVSLIPFLGFAGLAFLVTLFAFPIMVLLWLSKYQWGLQGIDKNHEDLKQARRRIMRASIIWSVMFLLRVALEIIAFFVMSQSRSVAAPGCMVNPSRFDYPRRLGYIIYLTLFYQSRPLSYRNETCFNIN